MGTTFGGYAKYRIVLLTKDAEPIHEYHPGAMSKLEAITIAKWMISDEFATHIETTHEALETHKVEILNYEDDNVCVWDKHREAVTA